MSRRTLVRVEYDGTDFRGWQVQPGLPTVQGALHDALKDLTGSCTVTGVSRTDSGVHALDQLALLEFDHRMTNRGLCKALNKRLPNSIAVREPTSMDPDFDILAVRPTKTYAYRVRTGTFRQPIRDRNTWQVRWPLDLEAMHTAAQHLVGEHDFVSFAAANHGRRTTVRRMRAFELEVGEVAVWRLTGDGFLKQMVRNIMGTLVDVGRGHWTADRMREALVACSRSAAGPTAPSLGLTLERIWWDPERGHRRP